MIGNYLLATDLANKFPAWTKFNASQIQDSSFNRVYRHKLQFCVNMMKSFLLLSRPPYLMQVGVNRIWVRTETYQPDKRGVESLLSVLHDGARN